MINESIAHYRVTAKIGAGGMGEVYRATDTKLGRDVALKVLPEAFAQDTQRMQRFQREAQVLASLNHPGIAAIYGFEESGSTHALAMELVEGPTLAERIGQGPIPVEEALPLAKQIAEALEYAHDHGIIHRDLKPANIKLTPDGKVKILDFGLAKALAGEVSQLESLNSPTLSIAATQAGIILGTAAYMSPEQAKGKSVDRRCDIWAFGVVLFEMLTGRRLYEGETASETMAAVIMKDPAFDQLPPGLPPAIRNLLARCLRKDPKLRLQSIGDARVAIEEAANPSLAVDAATTAPPGVAPTAPAWGRVLPWALAGVLAVALGVSLWRTSSTDDAARVRPARFFFSVAENQALNLATSTAVAISPDGSKMAYTARLDGIVRLFLRPMDRLEATPIPGTENAAGPFFSPDGDWVAFFAEGRLKKVPLAGGPAVTLATEVRDNRSGTWAGNTIVYGPDAISGLFRVSADGGQPQPLTTLDEARKERTHRFPRFLPDGRTVLFTVGTQDSPDYYDNSRIDAVRLDTGERKTVLEGASMADYSPSGHLIYARAGALFAVPFDAERLAVTGTATTVLEGVGGDVTTGAVHFSLSADGTLFHVAGSYASGDTLARMDRRGKVETLPAPKRIYLELSLSPDGRRAAVVSASGVDNDIWIYEFARGTLSRLTFGGVNRSPKWSPDGSRVLYMNVDPMGSSSLYSQAADGSGEPLLIRKFERKEMGGGLRAFLEDVSPDGKWLSIGVGAIGDIVMMTADGRGELVPFAVTDYREGGSAFSPDGRWVAYPSGEQGQPEVYVRALGESGGKWQVSTGGGEAPRWSRNGNELFYKIGNRMMVVPVQTSPTFQHGAPQLLFDNYFDLRTDTGVVYDVSPDGQWFLAVRSSSDQAIAPDLHVVLKWTEELKRLAPSGR